MSILITGGSGFIGSTLVDKLLKTHNQYNIIVIDNLSTGNIMYLQIDHPKLIFIYDNISNKNLIDTIFKEYKIDYVVHLAAMSKVKPSLGDVTISTFCVEQNILGTSYILENCVKYNVKKFIFGASSTYYGNKNIPFTESDRFQISSPYATTKYMGEELVNTYNKIYGLPTICLRFFMVYGPREPDTGSYAIVTGIFTKQKNEGKSLTIEGTGEQSRDFIHVEDICDGIIKSLYSELSGEVINLGSGEKTSIKSLANMISKNQVHLPERKHDLKATLCNCSKAYQKLNFKIKHEFKVSMEKIIEQKLKGNNYFAKIWKTKNTEVLISKLSNKNFKYLTKEEKNIVIANLFKNNLDFRKIIILFNKY